MAYRGPKVRTRFLETLTTPSQDPDTDPQGSEASPAVNLATQSPSSIIGSPLLDLTSPDSIDQDEQISPISYETRGSQDDQANQRASMSSTLSSISGSDRPLSAHVYDSTHERQAPRNCERRPDSSLTASSQNSHQERQLENLQYHDALGLAGSLIRDEPYAALRVLHDEVETLLQDKEMLSEQLSERSFRIQELVLENVQLKKDRSDFHGLEVIMGDRVTKLEEELEKTRSRIASMAPYRKQQPIIEPCEHIEEIRELEQQIRDLNTEIKALRKAVADKDREIRETSRLLETAFASERALTADLFQRCIFEPSIDSPGSASTVTSPERLDSVMSGDKADHEDDEDTPTPSEYNEGDVDTNDQKSQSERDSLFEALRHEVTELPDTSSILEHLSRSESPMPSEQDFHAVNSAPYEENTIAQVPGIMEYNSDHSDSSVQEGESQVLSPVSEDKDQQFIRSETFEEAAPVFLRTQSQISSGERNPRNLHQLARNADNLCRFDESTSNERAMDWAKALPDPVERSPTNTLESLQDDHTDDLEFAPVSSDISRLSTTLKRPALSEAGSDVPSLVQDRSSKKSASDSSHSDTQSNHEMPAQADILQKQPFDVHQTIDSMTKTRQSSPGSFVEPIRHNLPKPISVIEAVRPESRQSGHSQPYSAKQSESFDSSRSSTASKLMRAIADRLDVGDPTETMSIRLGTKSPTEASDDEGLVKRNHETSRMLLEGVPVKSIDQLRPAGLRTHRTQAQYPAAAAAADDDDAASHTDASEVETPVQELGKQEGAAQELTGKSQELLENPLVEELMVKRPSIGSPSIEPLPVQEPSLKGTSAEVTSDKESEQQSPTAESVKRINRAPAETSETSLSSDSLEADSNPSIPQRSGLDNDKQGVDAGIAPPSTDSAPGSSVSELPVVPFRFLDRGDVRRRKKLTPVSRSRPVPTSPQGSENGSQRSATPSPTFPRDVLETLCNRMEDLLNSVDWQQIIVAFKTISWQRALNWIYMLLMAWLLISTYIIRQEWLDSNTYMVRESVMSHRDEKWSSDWLVDIRGALKVSIDAVTTPEKPIYYA